MEILHHPHGQTTGISINKDLSQKKKKKPCVLIIDFRLKNCNPLLLTITGLTIDYKALKTTGWVSWSKNEYKYVPVNLSLIICYSYAK